MVVLGCKITFKGIKARKGKKLEKSNKIEGFYLHPLHLFKIWCYKMGQKAMKCDHEIFVDKFDRIENGHLQPDKEDN